MSQFSKILIVLIIGIVIIFNFISCRDKDFDFWNWFSKNQIGLYHYEKDQQILFDELTQRLKSIDSNLVFEFSPIRADSIREFTISADGLKESFPTVIKLVEKAPKIPKWEINAFRQRVAGDGIQIVYDDSVKISYNDMYFRYTENAGRIDLELNIKNYKKESGFDNAVFILLDALIGEYDMETRISGIDRKLLDESKLDSLHRIVELRDIVDNLKKKN
jgi:hypothetical protein